VAGAAARHGTAGVLGASVRSTREADVGRSRGKARSTGRRGRAPRRRTRTLLAAVSTLAAATAVAVGAPARGAGAASHGSTNVLLVGTFHGVKGQYSTIQSAVDAARPGDWILVGPGDYHEDDDLTTAVPSSVYSTGGFGGVVISTPDLHLIGMNRSQVVVDGTKSGAPGSCNDTKKWQQFGPTGSNGKTEGRNGIVVLKADGVTIENLTVCNFMAGAGDSGNQVWWNGGDGSGMIGLTGYSGAYLTGTSTYYGTGTTAAEYGIFSSNSQGPATWNQIYGSNMDDSGSYVGACQQVCDVTIDHAWMENDALGYSGTNSGGAVVIENSQFDNNKDGLDTNTQIDGDPPAPQNGNCPGDAISPITHTRSCWVFIHNDVHNNNNPNVPEEGSAGQGPTGTGMTISGAHNVTVMDNTYTDNGAWGILFVPYPDTGTPVLGQTCAGTSGFEDGPFGCVYDPTNDALLDNTFSHDGYFKNPSNSDFGQITLGTGEPRNCFADNTMPNGSAPANLEQTQPTCGPPTAGPMTGGPLLQQVLCDSGDGSCTKANHYPKFTGIVMRPLPKSLASMPDPCAGVPDDAWCSDGRPI
jgi:hypothetical protein